MNFVGSKILFPIGANTDCEMSQSDPGPTPCPGTVIAPFAGEFPDPAPNTVRAFRLAVAYYDENAAGQNNVQLLFQANGQTMLTFTLPQVASAQGAVNHHYSPWYQPASTDFTYYDVYAYFNSNAPYDNHAGVYSVIVEAWDVDAPLQNVITG